jgi:hypothetical protein
MNTTPQYAAMKLKPYTSGTTIEAVRAELEELRAFDTVLRDCLEMLWKLDRICIFTPRSMTDELEAFVRRDDVVAAMKLYGLPHYEQP